MTVDTTKILLALIELATTVVNAGKEIALEKLKQDNTANQ